MTKNKNIFFLIASCLAVWCVIWAVCSNWPWIQNPYNSYALQAKSWLSGRLDLGTNYSHLEIAEFGGKYFISFPPFPSVVMLPFVLLGIPDGFAVLLVNILTLIFTYKLCLLKNCPHPEFITLFTLIGSNILLSQITAWVWFFAQGMSFLLTVMSFYFAERKKGILSLLCWALAIGCRPFQIVYLPLLMLILSGDSLKNTVTWFVAPAVIAIIYMSYNYARFGSVFEFGHNYLPEFLEAENGQFNYSYIADNLKTLIRLPKFENGILIFPRFNGMSVFLVFPIIIPTLVFSLKKLKNKEILLGYILAFIHILLITAHKTMGGYHFGNRYFIDVMPVMLYILLTCYPKGKTVYPMIPLFILGLGLNIIGITDMFLNA